MRPNSLWLLALGAAAHAFKDTSPFFLASTSERIHASSSQVQTAPSLLHKLSETLETCPSEYYILAFQPGTHSSDFAARRAAPRIAAKILGEDEAVRSSAVVNEVVGVLDAKQIQDVIERSCRTRTTVIDASAGIYPRSFDKDSRIIAINFDMLSPGSERKQQLLDNDGLLFDIMERIPLSSYTLLYVTSPREFDGSNSPVIYHSQENNIYQEPMDLQNLKRDYSAHATRKVQLDESASAMSNQSLFKEYQYFTPGLFMGLIASFVFIVVLYVGFSGLTSLEVSYAAFEKDASTATTQKKQQ